MGNNFDYGSENHYTANEAEPFVPDYAGFWIRFLAYIVDAVILCIFSMIIIVPLIAIGVYSLGASGSTDSGTVSSNSYSCFCCLYCMSYILVIAVQLLYFAWFESSKYMGTPGKLLLGLAVTDENGERLTFGHAASRYVVKIITNLILLVGFIAIAFSPKKQGLYDSIVHTLVVKRNGRY